MNQKNKIYVYPKLDAFIDLGVRIGGFGLANCLFVYARSLVLAEEGGYKLINPTWQRFGIGQYLRNEKDKRHYFDIFNATGITGLKKYYLIYFGKKVNDINKIHDNISDIVLEVEGLSDYFYSLIHYQPIIAQNLLQLSKYKLDKNDFNKSIAIHIRLGDFVSENRIPLTWYITIINKIREYTSNKVKFLVFSDGKDEELIEILQIKNVERAFMGNAMLDIIAMSYCIALVGSDSTFSGWAAFLGQNYSIFKNKHYGRVLIDETHDFLLGENDYLPLLFQKYLIKTIC